MSNILIKIKQITPKYVILTMLFPLYLIFITVFNIPKNESQICYRDFKAYYTAANIIKTGEVKYLYNIEFQKNRQIELTHTYCPTLLYVNLPFAALLFLPATLFTYTNAYTLYLIINTTLFFTAIYAFCRHNKINNKFTSVLILFIPIFSAVMNNQISILIFVLFASILIWRDKKNSFLSGISSGLLSLKPQYLIFIPLIFPLIKNKKKYILGLFLTIAVVLAVNILVYGKLVFYDYFEFLKNIPGYLFLLEHSTHFNLFSLVDILHNYISVRNARLLVFLLSLTLYILALLRIKMSVNKKNNNLIISALITYVLVLNLHTKYSDLILLILPVLLLFRSFDLAGLEVNTHIQKIMRYSVFFVLMFIFISQFTIFGYNSISTILLLISACLQMQIAQKY